MSGRERAFRLMRFASLHVFLGILLFTMPLQAQDAPDPAVLKILHEAIDGRLSRRVKSILADHPDLLFDRRACDIWVRAVGRQSAGNCDDATLVVILEAFVTKRGFLCGNLAEALDAGCTEAMKVILANAKPSQVLDLKFGPAVRATLSPDAVQALIDSAGMLGEAFAGLCAKDGPKSTACQRVAGLKERQEAFLRRVVSDIEPASLKAVVDANRTIFDRHRCALARDLIKDRLNRHDACQSADLRLSILGTDATWTCSMVEPLERMILHLCPRGLESLVARVAPEELAKASEAFNRDGRFTTGTLTMPAYHAILEVGRILEDANRKACSGKRRDAPPCQAAGRVKGEVAKVEAAREKQESPETIRRDACDILAAMAMDRKVIETHRDAIDWVHLFLRHRSEMALGTWEARLAALKTNYRKRTGQDLDTASCR